MAELFDGYHYLPAPGGQVKIVNPDGVEIGRSWNSEGAAALLHRMQRAAKARSRACLCCGTSFLSEGAHHRMCTDCRAKAAAMA
jgi:hypothetical protein